MADPEAGWVGAGHAQVSVAFPAHPASWEPAAAASEGWGSSIGD